MGSADLVIVAFFIFVAACAQMVSGFGFALMAVPLMGLAIDVKSAVVISTICGTASNTFQAITGSHHRDGRLVKILIAASVAGMPFGVVLLDRFDIETLQIIIGIVVLLAVVGVAQRPYLNDTKREPALEAAAGFVSGVLATSTSTNGPPLVLLLRSKGLSPDQFRATINTVFSIVAMVSVVVFALNGRMTMDVLRCSLVGVPGLVLGMALGWTIRGWFSAEVFWRIVLALLLVTATSSILSGVL